MSGIIIDASSPDGADIQAMGLDLVCIRTIDGEVVCWPREDVIRIEAGTPERNTEIRAEWERAEQQARNRLRTQIGFLVGMNGMVLVAIAACVRRQGSQMPLAEADNNSARPLPRNGIWLWLALSGLLCLVTAVPVGGITWHLWVSETTTWPMGRLFALRETAVLVLFVVSVPLCTSLGFRIGERRGHPHVGSALSLAISFPLAVLGFLYYALSRTA